MRWLVRFVLLVAGTAVLVLVAGFCWPYFYSRDLPDITALAQYAPTTVTQVSDRCLGASVAVPFEAIGGNLRDAIRAVEANEGDPGVFSEMFRVLRTSPHSTALVSRLLSVAACSARHQEC